MKVKLSSQLLSGNMVSIIDTVCNHPLTYKMAKMPKTVEGRRWVFEKLGISVTFLIGSLMCVMERKQKTRFSE